MTPDEFTLSQQHLNVGNGHKLYVFEWGNDKAKLPIIYLHGGPGSSIKDKYKEGFEPSQQRVIFFDQRGCGQSQPYGQLQHNTTADMVEDINKIADHFGLAKFIITGGSWGSCLALAYALKYPERIHAMVLRGIFTGSQAEIDWLDQGHFAAHFPDVWDAYLDATPARYHNNPSAYHIKRLFGDNELAAKQSALAMANMEGALLKLDDRFWPDDPAEFDPTFVKLEQHYLSNRCFMPDRYILDNAHKLTMPIWLVQGRYDFVCPPATAYELHHKLPNSQLIWTTAGHHGGDRPNHDVTRAILLSLTSQA